MRIDFKNGSSIKTIDEDNKSRRGLRRNFIDVLCLDTVFKNKPVYVWHRVDLREPNNDRYIPVYLLQDHEFLKKYEHYARYYKKHPVEFAEMILGINLLWYQKVWLKIIGTDKFRI